MVVPPVSPVGAGSSQRDVNRQATIGLSALCELDTVARGTLGTGKSADGLQAVEWWKQGQIQKIIDYCLQDVKVTRDIFQYGRQNGFVKLARAEGHMVEVPVQWN